MAAKASFHRMSSHALAAAGITGETYPSPRLAADIRLQPCRQPFRKDQVIGLGQRFNADDISEHEKAGKFTVRIRGTVRLRQPFCGALEFADDRHIWTETFRFNYDGKISQLEDRLLLKRPE